MPVSYPSRVNLARTPTPIEPLDRLTADWGGPRIWIKRDDLTGSELTGNKVRKLEFVIAEARNRACDTLITCGGIQSNHCRATALAGARLGMKVHLILRGEEPRTPQGNLLLDALSGAEISWFSPDDFRTRINEIFDEIANTYRRQGRLAMKIPMGASDGIGAWAYIAAVEEIIYQQRELGITFDHILTATGSGGTQAGLTAGRALHGLHARVWGVNVCDNETWFQNKIRADLREWRSLYDQQIDVEKLDINVIDGYVGPGYAKATPEVFDVLREAARREGIVLDPVYTGKAFLALKEEIRKGRFGPTGNILFIHTGGIYGLLAQAAEIGW